MRDAEIVIALLISRIKPSNYAVDRCARARARAMDERARHIVPTRRIKLVHPPQDVEELRRRVVRCIH